MRLLEQREESPGYEEPRVYMRCHFSIYPLRRRIPRVGERDEPLREDEEVEVGFFGGDGGGDLRGVGEEGDVGSVEEGEFDFGGGLGEGGYDFVCGFFIARSGCQRNGLGRGKWEKKNSRYTYRPTK